MSIDFFNSEKILRLTPIGSDTIIVADNIFNNNVKVFPTLESVSVECLKELWEMTFPTAMSTYSLYVYALYPVSYLLNAFEITSKNCYLNLALELAENFLRWEVKENKKINQKRKNILFGDHAVSNRTQCLCYLAACLKSSDLDIPISIKTALLKNGEYLANSENYSHYNHGLMMDLALVGLLNTLEGLGESYSPQLKDSLLSRLKFSINRDITEDGVHIENSPGYHFWMLGFLGKIVSPLSSVDKILQQRASNALKKATEYASYITRPNGSVPAIGDTHAGVKFKPSKGLSSRFFQNANQVIFRNIDDSVWAHFGCGYKTHVHKHSDNGAFNLYYKGQDIFIDPGFLNYENSVESMEIKSSLFHNTVSPKGGEQSIQRVDLSKIVGSYKTNLTKSRISGFRKEEMVEVSLAYIADYDGVNIERLVIWVKPNVFLIYDSTCSIGLPLQQVFHVDPSLDVKINSASVNLVDSGLQVCKITQHRINEHESGFPSVELAPAFYAKKFNTKAESQRIVFETNSSSFLTVLELGDRNESNFIFENIDCLTIKCSFSGEFKYFNLAQLKAELSS